MVGQVALKGVDYMELNFEKNTWLEFREVIFES